MGVRCSTGGNATVPRPRVYIAGPISKGDINANVEEGIRVGLQLLDMGWAPFIPHASHHMDETALCGTQRYEDWLSTDFAYIQTCHALLRLPGESDGADREVAYAKSLGIPVYFEVESLPAPTVGDAGFHALLNQIGRLHDQKQRDYGRETDPFANVRASHEWGVQPWVGAMVRLTDKVRRLQRFAERGTLANESAEDSMLDIAVYALIALRLYREASDSPNG